MDMSNLWRGTTTTTEAAAIVTGRAAGAALLGIAGYSVARAIKPKRFRRSIPSSTVLLLAAAVTVGEAASVRRRVAAIDRNMVLPVREAFLHGYAKREEDRAREAAGATVTELPLSKIFANDLHAAPAAGSEDVRRRRLP